MNHLEFAAAESAALAPHPYERWCAECETALGHDLDGDQGENGYSHDDSYDQWKAGKSVASYVASVRAQPHYSARIYANGTGFPRTFVL